MKRFFIYLSLFAFAASGYSQTDTLAVAKRIAAMDYSKSDLISKSRRLLLQEYQAGNKAEVSRIVRYLSTEIEDESHLALWDYERYLIDYWTGNYIQLISNIELAAMDTTTRRNHPIVYPSDDVLGRNLQEEIKNNYFDEIVQDYQTLHFTPDMNDFLYLFLNYLLGSTSTRELNNLSDKFIKEYPYSPLVPAIKKYISYKFGPGNFGYGFLAGGGVSFLSGEIINFLSQTGGVSMDFHIYCKKLFIAFSISTSSGSIKQDIYLKQNSHVWPVGNDINILRIAPLVGMKVLEYKRFSMTPFVGISFNTATPMQQDIEENPYLKNVDLETSITPLVGLDADFTLNRIIARNDSYSIYYYNTTTLFSVGLRVAYWPTLITTQGQGMRGQLFFTGITLKADLFQIKRIY
jgi:hypothetical protein